MGGPCAHGLELARWPLSPLVLAPGHVVWPCGHVLMLPRALNFGLAPGLQPLVVGLAPHRLGPIPNVSFHTTQSPCHVSFRTTTCHPYFHVSACHWAMSCMDCHVSSVQCHVSNPYWCQLSPKMPNLSDMCHLLVMPCQHDDIIMTSC
jgi:hypothetical protein